MFIQLHDILSSGRAFWTQLRDIRWMERTRKQPEAKAESVECTELILWIPRPGMTCVAMKVWVTETPEFINQVSRQK